MPNPTLPSNNMSAETPKDSSLWHGKREVIKKLYVDQNQTLLNVKKTMERDYGFPTTLRLSDYKQVVRDLFKYRKNLSADEWNQSVGPEIARRKAAGKLSAVFIDGSEVEHVHRKIQRSLRSKRSRPCPKANPAALPYGVVIRTPSPQSSALVSPPPFGKDSGNCDLEQNTWVLSSMEFLEDYKAQFPWVSSLIDVPPLSGARPDVEVLSVQLLRQNSPIHELLIHLHEYQRKSNHVGLGVFGPNATISTLGKICFDFSNNLQGKTISRDEVTSILDWIGYQADISSLKTFFGQKALTILAAWEALNSIILRRNHSAALDVILSVHLSLRDQAPLVTGTESHELSDYLSVVPDRAATLIDAYPINQRALDQALRAAVHDNNKCRVELVQQLISLGASLKNEHYPFSLDHIVRDLGSRECQAKGLDFLKIILEAGAVVDDPAGRDWEYPGQPIHATDYLLLDGGYSTYNRGLWSLVASHSDRQQTTVTVPGIFEAAQGGHDQLRSYLNDRSKPCDDHDRKKTLEIALSEASGRGCVNVLQSLVQFGVDPNVRMLPLPGLPRHDDYLGVKSSWHPVVRAANSGNVNTLRMLVAVSSIDISLLDQQVGAFRQLDLRALREMEDHQLNEILRLLSTFGLATATRNEILLQALVYCDEDFRFVNQLLELGLASLDHIVYLDGEMHLLVRAIRGFCSTRSLDYLVEQDVRLVSGLSASTMEALSDAALGHPERDSILEFLSQKVEGFESYVQNNSSTLLLKNFQRCCFRHLYNHFGEDEDDDCSVMVTAKWLLGLGATLDTPGFSQLTKHASDSFILAMIDSMANIKEVDTSDALDEAIGLGRLNLAVALIERGNIQLDDPLRLGSETTLQQACHKVAPLWFVKFLVDKGADVNAPPAAYSGTALQNACEAGAPLSYIRFLLDQGADVNALPTPGGEFTALQCAVTSGSMNMVGLLLDHGADVNALSRFFRDGIGPEGTKPSLHFLRALDVAVWDAHLDMVHFLIAAGARSSHPGLTGLDGAITWATKERHFAIAALLQEHAYSHRGDLLEAERRWLQANPDARMYEGRIVPQAGPLMEMEETEGWDSEPDIEDVDGLGTWWL